MGSEEATTWTDLGDLWKDMRSFATENPGATLLSADHAPFMGWVAISADGTTLKSWRIGLADAKKTIPSESLVGTALHQCFKSPGGRQLLCSQLTGCQRTHNPLFDGAWP